MKVSIARKKSALLSTYAPQWGTPAAERFLARNRAKEIRGTPAAERFLARNRAKEIIGEFEPIGIPHLGTPEAEKDLAMIRKGLTPGGDPVRRDPGQLLAAPQPVEVPQPQTTADRPPPRTSSLGGPRRLTWTPEQLGFGGERFRGGDPGQLYREYREGKLKKDKEKGDRGFIAELLDLLGGIFGGSTKESAVAPPGGRKRKKRRKPITGQNMSGDPTMAGSIGTRYTQQRAGSTPSEARKTQSQVSQGGIDPGAMRSRLQNIRQTFKQKGLKDMGELSSGFAGAPRAGKQIGGFTAGDFSRDFKTQRGLEEALGAYRSSLQSRLAEQQASEDVAQQAAEDAEQQTAAQPETKSIPDVTREQGAEAARKGYMNEVQGPKSKNELPGYRAKGVGGLSRSLAHGLSPLGFFDVGRGKGWAPINYAVGNLLTRRRLSKNFAQDAESEAIGQGADEALRAGVEFSPERIKQIRDQQAMIGEMTDRHDKSFLNRGPAGWAWDRSSDAASAIGEGIGKIF